MVELTDRQSAVARIFLARYKPAAIKNEEWKEIATEAGITDGDVARNAKYAWSQFMTKITEVSKGSPNGAVNKRKNDTLKDGSAKGKGDGGDDDDEEPAPKKVATTPKPKVKGKGKGKGVKSEPEDDVDGAED